MENNFRQITLKLSADDHLKFKVICASKKVNMAEMLEKYVKTFIADNIELVEHLNEEK